MYKDLTYVTLSKKPLMREVPNGSSYVNHNSVFNNMSDSLKEYLNAINKVETDYFCLWDDDDPMPTVNLLPTNCGLVYGDMYVSDNGVLANRGRKVWNKEDGIRNPFLLHRTICRTDATKELQKVTPMIPAPFEYLYHYLIAARYGVDYDGSFISIWNRKGTGAHNMANLVIRSTGDFIRLHGDEIISKAKDLNYT